MIMKSLLERLHVCWLVLTSHSYYTFFVSKKTKVIGAYIENPTERTDKAIITYLKSDMYLKRIEELRNSKH